MPDWQLRKDHFGYCMSCGFAFVTWKEDNGALSKATIVNCEHAHEGRYSIAECEEDSRKMFDDNYEKIDDMICCEDKCPLMKARAHS
jgi:hypothetical protein